MNSLHELRNLCARIVEIIDRHSPDPVEESQIRIPLFIEGRCEAITQHAIDRYRERTGTKKSDANICNRIAIRIAAGEEWELKPKFRVIEMLSHGEHARYFRNADMMFVVESGVIVTCHHGEADRWMPKK